MRLSLFDLLIAAAAALDPNCFPGGNFDLTKWNLQLPTGSTGSPSTKTPSQLQSCSGFSSGNFYTDGKTGDLVMTVPGSPSSAGCVTSPEGKHCRTVLRETNPSSWSPRQGSNRLRVELTVTQPDKSQHGTVIGHIHIDDSISSKPFYELFYNSNGLISMGVEYTRSGGNLVYNDLVTIPSAKASATKYATRAASSPFPINDIFTQEDQNELANPNSYFRVGKYNQGEEYSEVRFHSISVSHGSNPATGAHAVSTISTGGIGPVETIWALDATVKPYPSPTGACGAAPTKYSDSTVQVALYYEDDRCHGAVGQTLFNRVLKIEAYQGLDCTGGSASGLSLSNSKGCQAVASGDAGYLRFMVSEPATCAVDTDNGGDNTVTLDLYSEFGCCKSIENIKIGNVGVCHDSNAPFHSLSQAVGTNMFGWLYHIYPYTGKGCSGHAGDAISLTNNKQCTQNDIAWNSFKISQDCNTIKPPVSIDNTVILALYRDGDCWVPTVESTKIGNLDT